MHDPESKDEPQEPPKAQPWHAADEQPPDKTHRATRRGEPTGTHSFTGTGASVGIPKGKPEAAQAEPGDADTAADPGPAVSEPRAGTADLLGRKPRRDQER